MANKQNTGGARRDSKGRRIDNRGRLLRTGEQQTKNGRYMYTYVNPMTKKKEYIYSWKLEHTDRMPAGKRADLSLREKIKQLEHDLFDNIVPKGAGLTVLSLVEMYVKTRRNVKETTKAGYRTCINFLKEDPFGSKRIDMVSVADAKLWLVYLQNEKKMSMSSIKCKRGVLKPAFQLAVESDYIRKNPFSFQLMDLLIDDSVKRFALTQRQERLYLNFLKNDEHFSKYYDGIYLLFKTGLRIGEFCGLTLKDINFEENYINIDHQLLYVGNRGAYIQTNTKTDAGVRKIPMDSDLRDCLLRIVNNRKKLDIEYIIDGYSGFLFLNENDMPMLSYHWEKKFEYSIEKYNKIYKEELPKFTPHYARHTRISRWIKDGLSIKSVQYLAGHADISTTLGCYTHWYFEDVKDDISRAEKANVLIEQLHGIGGSKAKKKLLELIKSA